MNKLLYIIALVLAVGIAACTQPSARYDAMLNDADEAMQTNTDDAMAMLDAIDPSELKADSLKARYHYLRAYGHMRQNRSMIADSLISSAHDFFRGKDIVREMRSATAWAWYKFWVGDPPGAIALLDSLTSREDVPDSLMVQSLRVRVLLGASEYQGAQLIPLAKRLEALERDTLRKVETRYILMSAFEYANQCDSALSLVNQLIDYAAANRWGDKQFQLEMEKAEILNELGRYGEGIATVDGIFKKAPGNGAAHYLHLHKAMSLFNMGKAGEAAAELALADSIAAGRGGDESAYYNGFSRLLHTMMDFRSRGVMTMRHVAEITNRQQERINRTRASQWEAERGALKQQSRAMELKAESEHKTVLILVIVLVAVILLALAAWIIRHRRLRERENEERAEALQKMVDELNSAPVAHPASPETPAALRRAMLQQLGIIKMVAETPTEQNREMLRKISSIDGEIGADLVNWDDVFELIDNLYSGFYRKLHCSFGDTLTRKEEQIIVLMMAGFSTKEISVITGQTTSTIYVRKSAIRKKLGASEKEDIVAFLRQKLKD